MGGEGLPGGGLLAPAPLGIYLVSGLPGLPAASPGRRACIAARELDATLRERYVAGGRSQADAGQAIAEARQMT